MQIDQDFEKYDKGGIIKNFNNSGLFGFIYRGENKSDLFFHVSNRLGFSHDVVKKIILKKYSYGSMGERYPWVGEEIYYQIGIGEKGECVIRWLLPMEYYSIYCPEGYDEYFKHYCRDIQPIVEANNFWERKKNERI